jgi:hypothetical protein
MKRIEIIPGFVVEPGNQSLRVVTLDFLNAQGFDPETGATFTDDMDCDFGGKKLKLYEVKKLKGGKPGARYHLIFSPNREDDLYKWNEYMFEEYWKAKGVAIPPKKKKVRLRDYIPEDDPYIPEEDHCKTCFPKISPKKKDTKKLIKMLLLMQLFNKK